VRNEPQRHLLKHPMSEALPFRGAVSVSYLTGSPCNVCQRGPAVGCKRLLTASIGESLAGDELGSRRTSSSEQAFICRAASPRRRVPLRVVNLAPNGNTPRQMGSICRLRPTAAARRSTLCFRRTTSMDLCASAYAHCLAGAAVMTWSNNAAASSHRPYLTQDQRHPYSRGT